MRTAHDCPDYCHPCPYMRGAVLPMCWGTVMGDGDDMSMALCHCDPAHPDVAKAELAFRSHALLSLMRRRRRDFRPDLAVVKRLVFLSHWAKFATPQNQREAWDEVGQLARRLFSRAEIDEATARQWRELAAVWLEEEADVR